MIMSYVEYLVNIYDDDCDVKVKIVKLTMIINYECCKTTHNLVDP